MDRIHTRLDEIRQEIENDEELQRAKNRVGKADEVHLVAHQALKLAEVEVEKQKIKIELSEANLYSGGVTNPKELQDLQNEVSALKRHLNTLEDRQLEAMLEEEKATTEKQVDLDNLDYIQKRVADQNKNLITEQAALEKELDRSNSEREAALSPLDTNLLTVYHELRQQMRGLAVAILSERACAACGTTLTPAQNQSAHSSSEIYHCPSCKRILFPN